MAFAIAVVIQQKEAQLVTGPVRNKVPRSRPQKYAVLSTGVILIVTGMWFGTAGMLYTPATASFPFRTAGWFILGSPCTLVFGLLYASVFWLLFRWTGVVIGWCLFLVCSAAFIVFSIQGALPSARLQWVLGEEAAQQAHIEYLSISDSFNDGLSYVGKVSGPETLLQSVIAYRSLVKRKKTRLDQLKHCFENDALPEEASVYYDADYGDNGNLFYFHPENDRLYFFWRSAPARELNRLKEE